jgi:UDP-N-acetylmuramate dehydrogenase
MQIERNVQLLPYTTFKMGGDAAYFAKLSSAQDIKEYARFARSSNLQLILLGGGSNSIFPSEGELAACVGKIEIQGFEILSQNNNGAVIKVGAGENWDSVVERAVALGLSGLEALSAIPGSVGATPVQNVGAYGQEIAQVLIELEAFDLESGELTTIPASSCGFAYRDSKFKHEWKGKYAISSITLQLSKHPPQIPDYPGVKAYFAKRNIKEPTLRQIREAIIEIRRTKLPDPADIASCGSFFKNPIISKEEADAILAKYPQAIHFDVQGGVKFAAGWMLDTLGFKGKTFGRIGVYPHNALVLTNLGGATRAELEVAVSAVQKATLEAFGVALVPEVVWVA